MHVLEICYQTYYVEGDRRCIFMRNGAQCTHQNKHPINLVYHSTRHWPIFSFTCPYCPPHVFGNQRQHREANPDCDWPFPFLEPGSFYRRIQGAAPVSLPVVHAFGPAAIEDECFSSSSSSDDESLPESSSGGSSIDEQPREVLSEHFNVALNLEDDYYSPSPLDNEKEASSAGPAIATFSDVMLFLEMTEKEVMTAMGGPAALRNFAQQVEDNVGQLTHGDEEALQFHRHTAGFIDRPPEYNERETYVIVDCIVQFSDLIGSNFEDGFNFYIDDLGRLHVYKLTRRVRTIRQTRSLKRADPKTKITKMARLMAYMYFERCIRPQKASIVPKPS